MKKILLGSFLMATFFFVGSAHAETDVQYDHKAELKEMVNSIINWHKDGYSASEIVDKLNYKKEIYKKEYEKKKHEVKEDYKKNKEKYKKDYQEKHKEKEKHSMSYENCVKKGGTIYEKEPPVCEYDGKWAVQNQYKVKAHLKKSMRRGEASDAVYMMQKRLNKFAQKKGYGNVSLDGKFGPATEKMVRMFQKYYNLAQDGVVGTKTSEKLEIYNY